MNYWIHIQRSLDRVVLHRERCLEIPSSTGRADFWEGGWYEYPDKDSALDAMENSGVTRLVHCSLCKP